MLRIPLVGITIAATTFHSGAVVILPPYFTPPSQLFVAVRRLRIIGGAENDGHEIAGHEIGGPSSRA